MAIGINPGSFEGGKTKEEFESSVEELIMQTADFHTDLNNLR